MKKTLTVNLGGTVYHIDEDAYNLLDNYLNNLRYHFRKEEGADEIVRDMETRIAELFDEYIRTGLQVITVEQVEAVIARMGNPEDLNTDDDEERKKQNSMPMAMDLPAVCFVILTTVYWVVCFPDFRLISAGM